MNRRASVGIAIILIAILVLISQAVFTVHQVEQVLVVQLGKPVRAVIEPGIHFKIPFIQETFTFDRRLLVLDQESQEVLSSDKKNLKVDNYAQWRIEDPLKFYQTVRNEAGAESRLNDIVYSNLREVLGQFTMMEIVSGERLNLMKQIREQANIQTKQYGIGLVDVRIKRTDLPAENSKAVYRRMQTERERQAKQYRAEGEEEAVKIRSQANREREVMLAEAYGTAQKLRGEGDALAAAIYGEAFQQDPRFYEFVRSLETYRKAFVQGTTLVLEPEGLFRYFKGPSLNPR
ncbi:MAG: protease modulator HflC [Magnetococcales bacterium]|nr:protease modulator HflC [Magnetococcales bacterium]